MPDESIPNKIQSGYLTIVQKSEGPGYTTPRQLSQQSFIDASDSILSKLTPRAEAIKPSDYKDYTGYYADFEKERRYLKTTVG